MSAHTGKIMSFVHQSSNGCIRKFVYCFNWRWSCRVSLRQSRYIIYNLLIRSGRGVFCRKARMLYPNR
jgi:hypothetical protein